MFFSCGMVNGGMDLESPGPGLNFGFSKNNIASVSPSVNGDDTFIL